MAARLPYETQGGSFSEGATYSQLIEHLRLAQEAAAIISHHSKAQGDDTRAKGFLDMSEILSRFCAIATNLQGKGRVQ